MNRPLVSVIVPNFNHSAFLTERIRSILSQSYQNFELVLLDDCSSDDSDKLLREVALGEKVAAYVRNEVNSGSPFRQWVKGLKIARGQFVWIAESDDFATVDLLSRLVSMLQEHPDCHIAGCASFYTGADGSTDNAIGTEVPTGCQRLTDSMYRCDGREFLWRNMQQGNGLPNASALVVRNTPLLHTSIPLEMRYCGDWVTWIRLLAKHNLILCTDVMNHWRTHPQTTRWQNQAGGKRQYFWEHVDRPEYLREMLLAMLELRPMAGKRWNTFVFSGMLNHYRELAGPTELQDFCKAMGWRARTHLHSKLLLQPSWIRLKKLFSPRSS